MKMKTSPIWGHALGRAIWVALLLALAAAPDPAYPQDETITASCFKGNTDEGNHVGDISVNDPRNAGSYCNGEYIDCAGECIGCVPDAEDNQVCYDSDGRRVPATH